MTEAFGDRLRAQRRKCMLSLDELATLSQVSKAYLWGLENNRFYRPSLEKIATIARCLNVSVDYLFGERVITSAEMAIDEKFCQTYLRFGPGRKKRIREEVGVLINSFCDEPYVNRREY